MYKVYQDPKGTQCLKQDHCSQVASKSYTSENEETYRSTIERLNSEIKVINDKIKTVINNQLAKCFENNLLTFIIV